MLSIVLVDDHFLIQQGLKRSLESCSEFNVVGMGKNAEDGLFRIEEHRPDLAVIDLGLPDHSGLWLLRRIRKSFPDMPVLVLTMHHDPKLARVCLQSGATGYLRKSVGESDLLDAVRTVSRNEQYIDPELREKVLSEPIPDSAVSERVLSNTNDGSLPTPHELIVLQHLAAGMTNSQMADEMDVSISTIKSRLRSLFEKLEVENRTEAVAEALKRKLIVEH